MKDRITKYETGKQRKKTEIVKKKEEEKKEVEKKEVEKKEENIFIIEISIFFLKCVFV